jgi:hypothetical protein
MRRPPVSMRGARVGRLVVLVRARPVSAPRRSPEATPVAWPPGKLDAGRGGAAGGVSVAAQRRLSGSSFAGNLWRWSGHGRYTAPRRSPESLPVAWPPGKARPSLTAAPSTVWRYEGRGPAGSASDVAKRCPARRHVLDGAASGTAEVGSRRRCAGHGTLEGKKSFTQLRRTSRVASAPARPVGW